LEHNVPSWLSKNNAQYCSASMSQLHVQNLLNTKLLELKAKNPSFSLRAMARKLEMNPAAISEILKGQRRISRDLALKLADRLMLDPTERQNLLKDFPMKLKRNSVNREVTVQEFGQMKLNSAQFDYISNWENFALLSLIETKNFVSEVEWIAKRLNITEEKVIDTIDRLLTLNLITQNHHGEFKRTYKSINTSDDVASISIKKSHLNNLETAKEKLLEVDVKDRDYCSYTLSFDPALLPQVKEMIRRLQDDIDEMMKNSNATEVYRINTYLYPLTHLEKK